MGIAHIVYSLHGNSQSVSRRDAYNSGSNDYVYRVDLFQGKNSHHQEYRRRQIENGGGKHSDKRLGQCFESDPVREKYGYGGYLRLWIPWSDNALRLNELREVIADDDAVRAAVTGALDKLLSEK